MTTTAGPPNSSAAAACAAERKPRITSAWRRAARKSAYRHSSGATPMPPPTRSGRAAGGAGRKPAPSGPSSISGSPSVSSARRRVPGPTSSSRKSSSTPPPAWRRTAACENARGRNGRSPLPPPHLSAGGQHVELAGLGCLGAHGVARGDQVVGAQPAHAADLRHPPLGRALRSRRGVAHVTTRLGAGCSSCSEVTGGASPRPARMARWAALAPLMVVMQGTPRATAARRIS